MKKGLQITLSSLRIGSLVHYDSCPIGVSTADVTSHGTHRGIYALAIHGGDAVPQYPAFAMEALLTGHAYHSFVHSFDNSPAMKMQTTDDSAHRE